MANKYVRDITETFHTNNRTKIKRAALCESSNYISLTETPDSTGKIVIKNKHWIDKIIIIVIMNKDPSRIIIKKTIL